MTTLGVRARHAAGLSLLLASTLAAVGCDDDPSSPAEQEITIGGLFSLTGNWASLGVASKAAMEIAIEDVNAYVAEGNSGLRFTASIKDTKLEPATALNERLDGLNPPVTGSSASSISSHSRSTARSRRGVYARSMTRSGASSRASHDNGPCHPERAGVT